VALAGTRPTEEVSPPSAPEIPVEVPTSRFATFWQTVKPFGWQGLLLVTVLLVLYGPVLRLLVYQWYIDADYSHGFLVPLLSGYLIWQRRDKLRQIPKRPSLWGLAIVLMAMGLLFLGSLGAELFLARFSLLCTICGLVVYFCGGAVLRAMAFPIAFLLFAIPIPVVVYNEIVFPLQFIASKFATWTLETLNLFPIMREGNVLVLPGMTLEVVEACSGIRSLMSLLALAAGFGYVVERSALARWVLFLAMIPLAIISNGTRVMVTAIMANYLGPKAAEGFMHEFSGWVIFVVATLLFLGFYSLMCKVRKMLGGLPKDPQPVSSGREGK
jgi:exosortase